MRKKLLTWKNFLVICVGAAITKAIEGILGNRADDLLTLIWPSIQKMVATNLLSWGTTVLVMLVCCVLCLHFIQKSQMLAHSFAIDHKMLDLDDSLLRGLATWTPSLDAEKEMKRIITDLLLDTTAEFDGLVHRAALLLPDPSHEYLRCWANYQMPQESVDSMKFYIGPDQSRQQREGGVAGEVFLKGELQVGHLHQTNGIWNCEDRHHYIKFSGRRPFPPYLSFVNVPIIGIDPNMPHSSRTTCLGVICFDSPDKSVFDSEASHIVLSTFARRITAALLIFKLYQNLPVPQVQSISQP